MPKEISYSVNYKRRQISYLILSIIILMMVDISEGTGYTARCIQTKYKPIADTNISYGYAYAPNLWLRFGESGPRQSSSME